MGQCWKDEVARAFEKARSVPSTILVDSPLRKVFLTEETFIKFGRDVDIREATALSFIANSTTIPVPRVYRTDSSEDGTTIIEMEKIAGKPLSAVWPTISTEQKKNIAQQLNKILNELRSIEGQYIGSLERGPAVDVRRTECRGGPFSNEREFNAFLLKNVVSRTPDIYRGTVHELLSDTHRIVLTHGDLNPRNIMVRDGDIVGLLDWECAGWYPEYWEYVKFCGGIDSSIDWHRYSDTIFSQAYPQELVVDAFLGRLTRH